MFKNTESIKRHDIKNNNNINYTHSHIENFMNELQIQGKLNEMYRILTSIM